MTIKLRFPVESIRCQRDDYILQQTTGGLVKLYRVEDIVMLSRLVPFGEDELIDERSLLDSERPAFMDEIYLLLTAFDRDFASLEETARAVQAGDLGYATEELCWNICRFPISSSQVYRRAARG